MADAAASTCGKHSIVVTSTTWTIPSIGLLESSFNDNVNGKIELTGQPFFRPRREICYRVYSWLKTSDVLYARFTNAFLSLNHWGCSRRCGECASYIPRVYMPHACIKSQDCYVAHSDAGKTLSSSVKMYATTLIFLWDYLHTIRKFLIQNSAIPVGILHESLSSYVHAPRWDEYTAQ